MQSPIANTPYVLSQNLQLLMQIVDTQQQMLQRQQEWMRPGVLIFKMPRMTSEDDPEAYIEAFECHAILMGLDKVFWASQLGALVVGKAQEAYQAMPRDEAWDYDAVTVAMLYRLEINPEDYRRMFRAKKGAEERRPCLLLQLLRELFGKWINLATCDREAVVDQIILEQFLDDLEGCTQQWVQQHSPSSCKEALELAEAFRASEGLFPKERCIPAHTLGGVKEVEKKKGPIRGPVLDIICFHCGKMGRFTRECPSCSQERWRLEQRNHGGNENRRDAPAGEPMDCSFGYGGEDAVWEQPAVQAQVGSHKLWAVLDSGCALVFS
ncbi:hypothetical protein Y1Q_0020884 [Alligator mississippiensis]|uniref:CCHC-type domain-containing protein n=1 Tax=Alligator mississippiensis TaxID=8496 RepID=A0A151NJ88_ALLMI|nr:hypothetical protein Y1Q_0020884 [Alligator mississippiensis]